MNTMHQGGKWKPKTKDLSIMDFELQSGSEKSSSEQIQKLYSESQSDTGYSENCSTDVIQATPKKARKMDSKSEKAADSLILLPPRAQIEWMQVQIQKQKEQKKN